MRDLLRSALPKLAGLFAAAFPVVLELEAHDIALFQRVDAGRFERGGMDEHVLAAVLRSDEAEALGCVEEFYCAIHAHGAALSSCVSHCRLKATRSARRLTTW